MNIIFLVASLPELPPDFLAMVQNNMHNDSRNSSKRETVRQSKLSWQEERRILLVGGLVEVEVVVENPGDVVDIARVVVRLGGLNGEIIRVPGSGKVDSHRDTDEEDDNAHENVGDGVEGRDQRGLQISAIHGPVERGRHQAIAGQTSKDLVDSDIVRSHPADPGEVG